MIITKVTKTPLTSTHELWGRIGHKAFRFTLEAPEGSKELEFVMALHRHIFLVGNGEEDWPEVDRYDVSFIGRVWEYRGLKINEKSGTLVIL